MKINQTAGDFESFEEDLYRVNEGSFDEIALNLFQFQAKNNPLYSQYINLLKVDPRSVDRIENIPFLPVSFFKSHAIKTGNWNAEAIFTSSGTTGAITSSHHVRSIRFYLEHAARCFSHFYGDPASYEIYALLPSYMERGGSSLIAMIDNFIGRNKMGKGGFYHNRQTEMLQSIRNSSQGKKLVWGVSYALLDLADAGEAALSGCIVMETGGMKGRRKEITRNEMHEYLTYRLHTGSIHSEYGMTELMSQAYSKGGGVFFAPPSMKILLRDLEDPRDVSPIRGRGGINIIDLANIHSCAFIETQDLGKTGQNGSFEVLGRIDNSDIRGCNLLVEQAP